MANSIDLWERPTAEHIYMVAGWRQWADAGSVSSGLPDYLIQQTNARPIGTIDPHGFYLFQVPGTHDLARPVVKFEQGYPQSLETRRNELFYTEIENQGIVIFLGDEPHLDIERYTADFLRAAQSLGVKRIIGLGGVYGELPYDKERLISCIYSRPQIKDELSAFAVNLSDYHGGASISSYICRRAGEQNCEFVAFYAFVPTYTFAQLTQVGNSIRIENDFVAWLGVMRRVIHMLKIKLDLSDLEEKSKRLIQLVDAKVEELDKIAPQLGVREHLTRLSDEFDEVIFDPLDSLWEEELRRLFNDHNADDL